MAAAGELPKTERIQWGLGLLGRYTPRNELVVELHAVGRGDPYVVAYDGFTGRRGVPVGTDGAIEVLAGETMEAFIRH
jgi:hypothetical protein